MNIRDIGLKISLTFYIVIFVFSGGYAQETGTIKGKVIEQTTKQPIAGATISIKNMQGGVISDSAGLFTIKNIPEGNYSLIISSVGYQQKVLNDIPVVRAKIYYQETELLYDAGKLGEVTVSTFKGEHNPI